MMRRLLTACALCLLLAAPSVVFAEDEGTGREEIEAKIKKKMEEIRRLMEENEKALLELSTGGKARPRRVDVEVPDAPDARGAKGGSETSGKGEAGGKTGEDIARRLRELIEGQRSQGQRIPKEIEQLLRMIPKRQGKGQGQPQDGEPKKGQEDTESQELRDARKQLDEQERRQGEKKPERGDKSKPAESDRMRTGKPEASKKDDGASDPTKAPWFTALPPEIRDALAGGQAEKIPPKFRNLIARYNLYLQKKASERGR